jgi:hypothetical protein
MLNEFLISKPTSMTMYTDNMNTVSIWNSLKASAPYNSTLMLAINSLIQYHTDMQVLHVLGVNNQVADALSHFNNALALHLVPGIKLKLFETPQSLLKPIKGEHECTHG